MREVENREIKAPAILYSPVLCVGGLVVGRENEIKGAFLLCSEG